MTTPKEIDIMTIEDIKKLPNCIDKDKKLVWKYQHDIAIEETKKELPAERIVFIKQQAKKEERERIKIILYEELHQPFLDKMNKKIDEMYELKQEHLKEKK